ncbi:MAG: ABC transporter ATP-binding protein [Raoultibacter sp.]
MTELTFNKVSLSYLNQPALKKVSFSLKENTICGLLGRNGSGKTSLMSLIASYRPATKGDISYNGEALFDNPQAMPNIAFVHNTADDNENPRIKKLFKRAALFRPNWDNEYAYALLEERKLSATDKIMNLSQGEAATVHSIIGLADRCPITLYDEAYSGMDAAVRTWFIQEILEDYLRHPRMIIFSTHFIGEVEHILGEVLVLDKGKLLYHESVDDLRAKGSSVIGDTSAIDALVQTHDLRPLSSKSLGSQKEIILFEHLPTCVQTEAQEKGLTLSHPSLQELFVHITDQQG